MSDHVHEYLPHGVCIFWNTYLAAAHLIGDGVTAIAYYAIPFLLWRARTLLRNELGRAVLLCFAAFILACGTTHVMDMLVLWWPVYWMQAFVKLVTAGLSISTAYYLRRIVRAAVTRAA